MRVADLDTGGLVCLRGGLRGAGDRRGEVQSKVVAGGVSVMGRRAGFTKGER